MPSRESAAAAVPAPNWRYSSAAVCEPEDLMPRVEGAPSGRTPLDGCWGSGFASRCCTISARFCAYRQFCSAPALPLSTWSSPTPPPCGVTLGWAAGFAAAGASSMSQLLVVAASWSATCACWFA